MTLPLPFACPLSWLRLANHAASYLYADSIAINVAGGVTDGNVRASGLKGNDELHFMMNIPVSRRIGKVSIQ